MWSDEGLSLYRANLSLAEVLANTITVDDFVTRDTNPPFYFLLLNLWRRVVGETVFALRFSGVVVGILAVPLLYVWAKRIDGYGVGLLAAFLMAISPFHVWQSQVLRNYGLLLTLNLLSVYGLFRFALSAQKQGRWLVLWAAAGLLGIYTHYFGFFVMAYGLFGLVITGWQRWRVSPDRWLPPRWLWLLGVAILVTLPIVPTALERFRAGRQIDFYTVPLGKVIYNGLSAFSVGMSRSLVHPVWQVMLIVLVAIVGLILVWRRHKLAALLLLAYQIVPIGLMLLLSLINPLYNGTRHLLIGLPPFIVALAVGMGGSLTGLKKPIKSLWQGVRPFFIFFAVGSQLLLLWAQFHVPGLVRDDVRGAAEYLSEYAEARDVVLVHDTLIRFTFDYYYRGQAPVLSVPQYARMDETEAIAALTKAGEGARRVWFLTEPLPRTGFPRDLLIKWASDHWQEITSRQFPWMWLRVGLKLYVPQPVLSDLPDSAVSQDMTWDETFHLLGIEAQETAISGSDWYPTLYWSQSGARRDYQATLRFVDTTGQLWAETDWPLWPSSQPDNWPEGQVVREDRRVVLPSGLPPGQYGVWLRLIDVVTQEPTLANGTMLDVLLWSDFMVLPNPTAGRQRLPEHTWLSAQWPNVSLVGFTWEVADYRPGHVLPITVYWQVLDRMPTEYEWVVQLLDAAGQMAAETITTPTRSDYPPTLWQPGELLQGQAQLTVPPRAVEGEYTVQIGWRDPQSGRMVRRQWWRSPWVSLGVTPVKPWPLQTELPFIPKPLAVMFGDPVVANLAGVELEEMVLTPGSVLPLTLFWQAQRETDTNYQIFVHLTTADDEIVAQQDILPVNGTRPTTSWRTGEVLVDKHEVWVGTEVPPGRYELWVGLYNVTTGERLSVFEEGAMLADGRYLLGMIVVEDE